MKVLIVIPESGDFHQGMLDIIDDSQRLRLTYSLISENILDTYTLPLDTIAFKWDWEVNIFFDYRGYTVQEVYNAYNNMEHF